MSDRPMAATFRVGLTQQIIGDSDKAETAINRSCPTCVSHLALSDGLRPVLRQRGYKICTLTITHNPYKWSGRFEAGLERA